MSGYDVIVLGLGSMGSAAAAHLAKRGKRVLGLEQFELGHELGSSSGRSRLIRKAYFEDPAYTPLLMRAYELWQDLENETKTTLLDLIGIVMLGGPGSMIIDGVRLSMERYDIQIDELSHAQMAERYPQMRLIPNEIVLFESDAGLVFPERGVAAHLKAASAHGAELRGGVTVTGWQRSSSATIRVELAGGEVVEGEQLVICAGPWLPEIAHDLNLPITVQRNTQVWFAPATDSFVRGRLPGFYIDRGERDGFPGPLYGFPDLGEGVKAALHAYGPVTTADSLDREIHPSDIAAVKTALDLALPGAASKFLFGKACMYDMTPDEHFIIDRHPEDDGIVIAGGFSGHGYKFCPVVGEIIADLVDRTTRHDIDLFALRRFASTGTLSR